MILLYVLGVFVALILWVGFMHVLFVQPWLDRRGREPRAVDTSSGRPAPSSRRKVTSRPHRMRLLK